MLEEMALLHRVEANSIGTNGWPATHSLQIDTVPTHISNPYYSNRSSAC